MARSFFSKYVQLREEAKPTVTSRIKLQKQEGTREFAPFTVNRTMHPNLRLLVKAFTESDKVGLGYTTIDKSKGEHEPQLKKKNLWLTGGAVREHLKGKTPDNYDLVTDATPSEIRLILTKGDEKFEEVRPKDGKFAGDERYDELPSKGKDRTFYVCRWDSQGKEIEFAIEVNGERFELATLGRHPKSRNIEISKAELASSVEEDAENRDFTMNAMYIPLTTADGDNSELIDPHGGSHHLKTGEVVPIGGLGKRLDEDPRSAMKYLKLHSRYGKGDLPEKEKTAIERHKDLADVDPKQVRDQFVDGLENPDVDPKRYVQLFGQSGLMSKVFPDVEFDLDLPEEFRGDRWLAPAWLLKSNDPEKVKSILSATGWSKQEAADIAYLIKLYDWASKGKYDAERFYDMKKTPTGLSNSKVREWMQMAKTHGPEFDAFLNHDDNDLSAMVSGEDGRKQVNPEYVKVLGRTPAGEEFSMVKRFLSTQRWKDSLSKLKA